MNNKFFAKLLQTGFLAVLLVFGATAANAQKGTSIVKRVTFAKGSSSIVLRGSVHRGISNDFLIKARAGQNASFYLEAGSGLNFTILSPDGEVMIDDETNWTGELPASGTYRINVLPDTTTNRAKSYKLTIRITN